MNTRRFAPLSLINRYMYTYIYMYIYVCYFQFFLIFFSFLFFFFFYFPIFLSSPLRFPNPFHFRHRKQDEYFFGHGKIRFSIMETRGDARSSTLRSASESHSPSPRLRSECLRDLSNKRDGCVHDRCLSLEYIESSTFYN